MNPVDKRSLGSGKRQMLQNGSEQKHGPGTIQQLRYFLLPTWVLLEGKKLKWNLGSRQHKGDGGDGVDGNNHTNHYIIDLFYDS